MESSALNYPHYPMPYTRIEVCVFGIQAGELVVLVVRREERPQKGMWALPGGVLMVDQDQSLEDAAKRVARERLRMAMAHLRQQCAVGGPGRDERAKWTLSVVYRTVVDVPSFTPEPGKRITDLKWVSVVAAGAAGDLAFDHADIIARATTSLRQEVDALEIPFECLPQQFTLTQLQQICEALLGRKLDKSSFRRRLEERAVVEPVEGLRLEGANRPAQIYRARATNLGSASK
jgi:hypothetical protein